MATLFMQSDKPVVNPKPLLVGEQNPYGSEPGFALYPAPEGCAGERLCCLILGMYRNDYLDLFERCNLCPGKWNIREAKARATELANGGLSGGDEEQPLILFGAKVAKAFELPFRPFEQFGEDILVLPHPSARNRMWNNGLSISRVRQAVVTMCPWLGPYIGKYDDIVSKEDGR